MDILKAEIMKKQKQLEENNVLERNKKLFKYCDENKKDPVRNDEHKVADESMRNAVEVNQAYFNKILSTKPNKCDRKCDVDVPDEKITYEDIQKMSVRFDRGDRDFDMSVITQFIQFLLLMWGNHLNSRSTAERMSTKGKMASATYAQTREYVKPLLRKLKNKSLSESITDSLTNIVKHMLDRNYILASDAYL
ncbi:hypothetical protein PV327_001494 [Microctonus hyperodae]|uniref:Pre-mRNA-splicing factor 18 n=1 Tax=Microctonus hyperodae TaxID=165561 RepID=A0AA39G8S7_MICHY|nr:hypothetical protein PV327_001494 [Microctonus hyperodae]